MADSQYSLASATINNIGSPLAGSVTALGLSGFVNSLMQLNQALNTVSLDIRLLSAGQNRLGETLASLTAVLSSARSLLKRGGEEQAAVDPVSGTVATDATASLNVSSADISEIVRSSGKPAEAAGMQSGQVTAIVAALLNQGVSKEAAGTSLIRLSTMLSKGDNGTADQLKAWQTIGLEPAKIAGDMRTDALSAINSVLAGLSRQPADQQASLLKVLFEGDEGIGKLLAKPEGLKKTIPPAFERAPNTASALEGKGPKAQSFEEVGSHPNAGKDALDSSLSRLGRAVSPDLSGPLTSLSAQVDKLSSAAEQHSGIAVGLSAIAVTLYSIVSVVGAAVANEALNNIAKKILKGAAPKPPFGLGDLISENTRTDNKDNKPAASEKGSRKTQGPAQGGKGSGSRERKLREPAAIPKDQLKPRIEVKPRSDKPVMRHADVMSMVSINGSRQASALLGKAARVSSPVTGKVPGLSLVSAGVDLAQGVANGDTKAVASSTGMLAGSYAGAALGSLILPGIGTAIGGFLGGIAGSWLGEKLVTTSDQLGAPDEVSKELTNTQAQYQQINYSPSIQVTSTGAQSAEQIRMIVEQQLQSQFHGEFVPLMTGNALATRRDAALTDGGM